MKRAINRLAAITLLLTLLAAIPAVASAMTQTQWNQQCRAKTVGSVTLYDIDWSALATSTDVPVRVVGSLGGGVYVKLYDYDDGLKLRQIGYLSGSSEAFAWVESGATTAAVAFVQTDDGNSYDVPEALMQDMSALCAYLARENPGYVFSVIVGSPVLHVEKAPEEGNEAWQQAADDAEQTAELLAAEEASLPKATVYAPRTGRASLRTKASSRGTVIQKLPAGTIVSVVKEGKNYSQILANGLAGYVLNSALKAIDPNQVPLGTGVITYKGNPRVHTTINVRSDGTGKGHKITEWATGTEVIVWSLSDNGDWYEIEHDGMRLYIQAQYLIVTPTEASSSEAAPGV